MPRKMVVLVALSALVPAFPAMAQDVERYQLERTENGYVRLDTQTGRMTVCQEHAGELVCRAASDERAGSSGAERGGLQARIEELEARIEALEANPPAQGLPTEDEFEQSMGYMEQFFRRFMGIVRDFERDSGADEPRSAPEPEADRT